jgi:FkbM family methyltransferase
MTSTKVLERSVNLIPWQVRRWIKDVPVVARLQRLFFRKFLSGRSFLHTINAGPAKGLVYPITLPLDKAIWTGAYETEFAQAVASSVNKSNVCYDIGAYRGFFSGVFAVAGAGRVIAFEPFPENYAQLQRLALNNPQLPLTFENIAIGREDGIAKFNVMPDSSMGKLASSSFQSEVPSSAVLKVSLRSLDSLISERKYPAPQIIKIDVEGAEFDVLQGAKDTLQKNRPLLFIEAHSRTLAADCTKLLADSGYRVGVLEKEWGRKEISVLDVCHLVARPH